ncbi:unnamed protein product [Cuscuta europaea]|uniref:Uncharacterized protein n=1 Tax=Cuscuta europaea TaxID=41803 RepID=A0A9P0ZSC5_CUSEU|nr:unnamed protein product [Cuscuta europaea]
MSTPPTCHDIGPVTSYRCSATVGDSDFGHCHRQNRKLGLSRRLKAPSSRRIFPLAVKMVKGRQGERIRLYVRGTVLGYKRSKSNQYPSTSLVQIEGVNTKEEVGWYQGKRMAYVYKAKTKKNGSHYRCIWGKVSRPHGNSGVVRAKFKSNLPPRAMGNSVRVFMYPSNI